MDFISFYLNFLKINFLNALILNLKILIYIYSFMYLINLFYTIIFKKKF